MTYEELCKQLEPYIQLPETFGEDLRKYHHTSRPSAKMIINSSLIEDEHKRLTEVYYCEKGWFKKAHDEGGMKLMLAANALGLIHGEFYRYDKNKYNQICEIARCMEDEVVDSLCKAYAKQKVVTCRALSAIRKNRQEIILYRGLSFESYDGNSEKIYFNGLESYTSALQVAEYFAGNNGWIIRRKCSIFDIFVYYTTLYRTNKIPTPETKYKIHKVREYIVENTVPIMMLSDELKIYRRGCYE